MTSQQTSKSIRSAKAALKAALLGSALTGALALPSIASADLFVPPGAALREEKPDGDIGPIEYANGIKMPMQDFVSGTYDGELFLQRAGDRLLIALRLPYSDRGSLEFYFDDAREGTLSGEPQFLWLGQEDRRLSLNYDNGNGTMIITSTQTVGDNGSWISKPASNWETVVSISEPIDDRDFIHIEAHIVLPTPIDLLGLGIEHLASNDAQQTLPNDPNNPPLAYSPSTWETLIFDFPQGIPLSVSSWNIGQLPPYWGDGGAGEPKHFAPYFEQQSVVCVNEAWDSVDRDALLDEVNFLRATSNLDPMHAVGTGNDDDGYQTTGLLVMSDLPILDYEILEYEECAYEDCLQDKGVIWARVLLEGGNPESFPGQPLVPGNPNHFIDVFCTHLQAKSEASLERGMQIDELAQFIKTKRANDRPALLLGDMNVVGDRPGETNWEYEALLESLDILKPTAFDKANNWLSDTYDLGLVDFTLDNTAPIVGTNISGGECDINIHQTLLKTARYDYILALPARDLWPAWGVAQHPTFLVEPAYVPIVSDKECLSDHALVSADLELIRIEQAGAWNPTKGHDMTYDVVKLIDHGSGGCCADWYTKKIRFGSNTKSYSDGETPDDNGYSINPGWSVGATMFNFDILSMEVEVWEWDSGGDDHYDSSHYGTDAEFTFDHGNGTWHMGSPAVFPIASFDTYPEGMTFTTTGDASDDNATVVHVLTAEEIP